MKKTILYLFAIFFTLSSCDVLDKSPLDMISDDIVWDDQVLLESYLTQCYLETYIFTNEVPSEAEGENELYTRWSDINGIADEGKNQSVTTVHGYKHGELRISGGLLEWWDKAYVLHRKLNEFIEKIPNSKVDNVEFKTIREAEARFLRAYSYFSMVKRYGGIPLIKQVQNINDSYDQLYAPRNKEQEVYDFVLAETEEIINILPQRNQSGRPSKYAALALRARAALYAGSIAKYGKIQLDGILGIPANLANYYFEIAYDATEEIITDGVHRLYDENPDKVMNFREMFMKKNTISELNNPEAIFVRPHNYTDALAGGCGWCYDFFQCPFPQAWSWSNQDGPYLEMVEEFEYIDGTSGKLDRDAIQQGLWTMEELWRNKDPRFFATIYTNGTKWKGNILEWHNGIITTDGTIQLGGSYEGVLALGTQPLTQIGTNTCFGVLKYLDENKDNMDANTRNASGTDWIVFRMGEVFLNYAEAAFELGRTNDALSAINKIRQRAGIADLTNIDVEKIRHERKIELAFEGHRYWDVRRWRTAVVDLTFNNSGLRYILDYTTRKYKLEVLEKIDGVNSHPVFFEHNYYLPVTLRRTGNNPNLIENPGY